ncbi:MAG: Mur ligase domain-containing protein, partial [Elusimicrobiales bacterium]|nr:Mur ligase domain-containing protein [Elusimicrobiales bacterium]
MSKYFFCAIAGSGMSALAQILKMEGHEVCGSDRSFDNNQNGCHYKKVNMNLLLKILYINFWYPLSKMPCYHM